MNDEEKLKLRFDKEMAELAERMKRSVKVLPKKEIDKMLKKAIEEVNVD